MDEQVVGYIIVAIMVLGAVQVYRNGWDEEG